MSADSPDGGFFAAATPYAPPAPVPAPVRFDEPPAYRHPGWAPPRPAEPVLPASVEPASESGVPVAEALAVTAVALAASLWLNLTMRGQQPDQIDRALRQGLAVTLFFYLGLGTLVALYVGLRRVRFTWHRGSAVAALALGVPVGAAGGVLAIAINSALRGHLSGDPSVELLVGGGGALRVFVAFAVTTLMAPLVEEVVFRGICAGSVVGKGVAAAMWVSAIAFAIWHMRPESLRYYALMGLLLARLWHKRGLLASMGAHAAFNGALTLAAVAATGGAATPTDFGALHFSVPGGWHATQAPAGAPSTMLAYEGPGGASLAVMDNEAPRLVTADDVLRQVETPNGFFEVRAGTSHLVDVAGVPGVRADVTVQQQPGHLVIVPLGRDVYTLVVVTGGSPKGERDWQRMLRTLRVA